MADYKSHSIFSTPAFTFLIGKDRSSLTIHAGAMQESNSRLAVLEDVEEDTFLTFCEFLYTSTYTTPNLTSSENSEYGHKTVEPSPANEFEVHIMESSYRLNSRKKGKKCKWNDPPWQEEESQHLSQTEPNVLFHAKLYVFATKYLVDTLRAKCLKSLHRDLCVFSLDKNTTSQILELIEFTYEHTSRDEPGGGSPHRDLVVHYAACKARTLLYGDGELRSLLDWNAELGSDLVLKLVT
ncbi:hypothetical protein RJZ57_005272 [Blastomyces gilchristii]